MKMTDFFELAVLDAKIQGIDFKSESAKKIAAVMYQIDIDEAMRAGNFEHAFFLMEFNKFIQNY